MFVFDAGTLTPSEKGGIAETAIAARAVELGIVVARPIVEGRRYDLIFDTGDRLLRVQCKWARLLKDVVEVRATTSRHTPTQGYVRSTYSSAEIDLIAAYCAPIARVFAIPIADIDGRTSMFLRLAPTRNNQRSLVRWASQYELGAIAQLEERCHGMAEAVGSSPTSSTPPKAASTGGLRLFRS